LSFVTGAGDFSGLTNPNNANGPYYCMGDYTAILTVE